MGKAAITCLSRDTIDKEMHMKVRLVKALVFPVTMYVCESWIIWNSEKRKIDAFGMW